MNTKERQDISFLIDIVEKVNNRFPGYRSIRFRRSLNGATVDIETDWGDGAIHTKNYTIDTGEGQ